MNAGLLTYKGETYNVHYNFALASAHHFDLNLELTHNEENNLSVAETVTQYAGTAMDPHWVARFDANYSIAALRLSYSVFYLPRSIAQPATRRRTRCISTTPRTRSTASRRCTT